MKKRVIYICLLLFAFLAGLGGYKFVLLDNTEEKPKEKEQEVIDLEEESGVNNIQTLNCTKHASGYGMYYDNDFVFSFENDKLTSYVTNYKMSLINSENSFLIASTKRKIEELLDKQEVLDGWDDQVNYENNILNFRIEHDLKKVSYDQIDGELRNGLRNELKYYNEFSKETSLNSLGQYLADEDYICEVKFQKQIDFSDNIGEIFPIDKIVSVTNDEFEYKHIHFIDGNYYYDYDFDEYLKDVIIISSYSINNKVDGSDCSEISFKFYDENKNELVEFYAVEIPTIAVTTPEDMKDYETINLGDNQEFYISIEELSEKTGKDLKFSDFKYFSIENVEFDESSCFRYLR